MAWKNKFKLAIIQKDTDALEHLLATIPEPKNISETKEFMFLIQEALVIFQELKNETAISMQNIKKRLSFLDSTQGIKTSKIDIKS